MNIGDQNEQVSIEVDTSDSVRQVSTLEKAYVSLIAQIAKLQMAGTKMGATFGNIGQQTAALQQTAGTVAGAFNQMASAVTRAGAAFNGFMTGGGGSGGGLLGLMGVLRDLRSGIWAVIDVVKLLSGPLFAIGGIIGAVGQEVLETLNKIQGFKATMAVVTSSSDDVKKSWSFLKNLADGLGVELTSLTSTYAKLVAAIPDGNNKMEIAQNLFLGVARAARTLHATNHDTQLMFYAITQMASKARVSMEELNRQLGEKLPGTMKIMAERLSTTPDKLMDAIRKGTVDSIKFLEQMGPALAEVFDKSSQIASSSVDAAINRLKNLWTETIKYMDDNGIGPELAKMFDTIRDKLSDPSIGKAFYETVKDITKQVTDFVKGLTAQDIKDAFNTFFDIIKAGTSIIIGLGKAMAWTVNQAGQFKQWSQEGWTGAAKAFGSIALDPFQLYHTRGGNQKTDQQMIASGQLSTGQIGGAKRTSLRELENQYLEEQKIINGYKNVPKKSLEDVLGASNKKGKKEQLSEGERYIKMLEQMQDRTEKLSEVDKIYSAIQEGRLKFDNEAQKQKAIGIAKEIDFAKAVAAGNKVLEEREKKQTALNFKFNEYLSALKDGVKDLEQEYSLLGLSNHEQEEAKFWLDGRQKIMKEIRQLQKDAAKDNLEFDAVAKEKELNTELQKQYDLREKIYAQRRSGGQGVTDWFNKLNDAATNSAQQIEEALTGAFDASSEALEGFLNTGRLDFKKWVADITKMANQMVSKEIMTTLFNYIRGLAGGKNDLSGSATGGILQTLGGMLGMFGSSFGGMSGLASSGFTSMFAGGAGASAATGASSAGLMGNSFYALFAGASKNGNGFINGSPQYFAKGGVFDRPTGFPMSNGRWGVMGEAGPEGILPLARDGHGRLGVRGGGGITMNVYTPNADSFRKSQRQILSGAQRQLMANGKRG